MKVEAILDLIPRNIFDEISNKTWVDYQVPKLKGRTIFNLYLLSFLETERVSLSTMLNMGESIKFQYLFGERIKTAKSSISDRLKTIDFTYFEKIFEELVECFKKLIDVDALKRIDSTLVTLTSKLLKDGMKVPNGDKNQIKFSVSYSNIPEKVKIYNEKTYNSEEIALKEVIKECTWDKDSIAVFDKGLASRNTFKEFNEIGIQFVTRLNNNLKYELISTNYEDNKVVDCHVYLYCNKGKIKIPFHLIILKEEVKNTKTGKMDDFYLLTNINKLNHNEVIEIYKKRWDIEVFFRFIKQELNAKHFLALNLNGIKVTFYMILIISLLLLIYKILNQLKGYKLVKKLFIKELELIIIRDIIEEYGGNYQKFAQDNNV